MKSIENLKRFLNINNSDYLQHTNIFNEFCLNKKVENTLSIRIKEILKIINENGFENIDQELKEEITEVLTYQRQISKESYYSYFKETFPSNNPLVEGEHIELICDILTLAESGLFKDFDTKTRIAISVPPRHLKSTAITNSYPSWFMSKNTFRSTIVTSYGDNLVEKAGEKNREKIKTICSPLFGSVLKDGVGSKKTWEIEGGGRFKAATIRGGATGEGAELLIIDDVVKNREDANSKIMQQKIWDEYNDTYLTRLHRNGILVVVMTRWDNNDLRGKIDDFEKNLKWFKLDLAAINETQEDCDNDALARPVGKALYPQMFDENYFEPFKKNIRTWNSLFKQKPTINQGEYFESSYFQEFTYDDDFFYLHLENGEKKAILQSNCWYFQTIDTAQKDKEIHDETAIATWICTPDCELLLWEMYHDRIKIPEQERKIDEYWELYKEFLSFQAIEDKGSGIGILQKLENTGRPVKAVKANQNKVTRAAAVIALYGNMKVYHKRGAKWRNAYESQLLQFPGGKNDDMVDVGSMAGNIIAGRHGIASIP
ncbi:MAG: phage terminase large subunit [Cetobacterium sp.]|uniref:phage terminase large subunit n=1 Tax=Cetobacterium sp. TaxID=2071632 RepID=UPI002FC9385D